MLHQKQKNSLSRVKSALKATAAITIQLTTQNSEKQDSNKLRNTMKLTISRENMFRKKLTIYFVPLNSLYEVAHNSMRTGHMHIQCRQCSLTNKW